MSSEQQPQARLSGPSLELIAHLLGEIPAHEVTVWLHDDEENHLLAIHNPVNPGIIGMSQPVSKGLISQVLVTGLPLLEANVSTRKEHDSTIDSLTGQKTRSLMAAPVYSGANVIGVVSSIQHFDARTERVQEDRADRSYSRLCTHRRGT